MKRVLLFVFLLLAVAAAFVAWNIFGPVISKPDNEYLYVKTGTSFSDLREQLVAEKIIGGTFFFNRVSSALKFRKVKPGRYAIRNGQSLLSLVRMLRSGNQAPVRFVINKFRTVEQFAAKAGELFEFDSLQAIQFLRSPDSLRKYGLDTNTAISVIIPDTYALNWNGNFSRLFARLADYRDKFWNEERKSKARSANLTQQQVYTLASIVEEESNDTEDKPVIASVYRNRLAAGQKLQADPTVKFAMKNFALKRIYEKYLFFDSPFNTYRYVGLPPGPICTPSKATIDAVLNAPATNYYFFVAKPGFGGKHVFTENYAEHMIEARKYSAFLDSLNKARAAN